MEINTAITQINNISDEQELPEIVLGFINDAISRINIECDANYPTYEPQDITQELPLPEKWIRALIIPFGVGRVKQRDSSQFEYTDAYSEFMENLNQFKHKYEIPEEYQDTESGGDSAASDIYENPPFRWWNF